MNYNVVALIRQDPAYKRMTSDDVFGRIINHEMYIAHQESLQGHHNHKEVRNCS
jgi:hypothetical protein